MISQQEILNQIFEYWSTNNGLDSDRWQTNLEAKTLIPHTGKGEDFNYLRELDIALAHKPGIIIRDEEFDQTIFRLLNPTPGEKERSPKKKGSQAIRLMGNYDWEEIYNNPSLPVFFVEGTKQGLSTPPDYPVVIYQGCWATLKDKKNTLHDVVAKLAVPGRPIYLVPDADAMTKHQVFKALMHTSILLERKGCRVDVINVPMLDGQTNTGLDDYLNTRKEDKDKAWSELILGASSSSAFNEKVRQEGLFEGVEEEDNKSKPYRLLKLIQEEIKNKTISLFKTPASQCDDLYFKFKLENNYKAILKVNQKSLISLFVKKFYDKYNDTISPTAVQEALGFFEGEKVANSGFIPEKRIENRSYYDPDNGIFYYNLNNIDNQVVKITDSTIAANGAMYEIVDADEVGEVEFIAKPGSLDLPKPREYSGDSKLHTFQDLFNLSDENYVKVMACLVGAMLSNKQLPQPMLYISGQKGTGKSELTKLLKEIIDPTEAKSYKKPKTEEDLTLTTKEDLLLAFENLSFISNEMSDLFCIISTGGAHKARKLYTDDELYTLVINPKLVIVNGISDNLIKRDDLLDRSVNIEMDLIGNQERKPLKQLWSEVHAIRPYILHNLFQACALAIKNRDQSFPNPEYRMRLLDWFNVARSAEAVYNITSTSLDEIMRENASIAAYKQIEGDIIADLLQEFMADKGDWEGGLRDLFLKLESYVLESQKKLFPKKKTELNERIKRLAGIEEVGIIVTRLDKRLANDRVVYSITNKNFKSTQEVSKEAHKEEAKQETQQEVVEVSQTPPIETKEDKQPKETKKKFDIYEGVVPPKIPKYTPEISKDSEQEAIEQVKFFFNPDRYTINAVGLGNKCYYMVGNGRVMEATIVEIIPSKIPHCSFTAKLDNGEIVCDGEVIHPKNNHLVGEKYLLIS